MKPALLFVAGFLMEAVWALGTLSLQRQNAALGFAAAAVAPFIAALAQAWTVVDEKDWRVRTGRVFWYALGAVCGLAVTWPW